MALLSKLDVINRACARIGADPFLALSDEIVGAGAAGSVYDDVVGFCLDIYGFPASRAVVQLSRLADVTPANGFAYAYLLPSDAIGDPLRVIDEPTLPDQSALDFDLFGRHVYSDAESLWAVVKTGVAPANWPPALLEAIVLALAAELALALASDEKKRRELRTDAFGTPTEKFRGGAMGVAINNAAQATPPRRLPGRNPLLDAYES